MEYKNINIRNLYIDLLNKIKGIEGVDKEYVDDLVEVIDLHLTALDSDLSAISSVIPEEASVTNPLITEDDLPPAPVNADWNASSGLAQILNKPTIPAAQVNSDWNATSGVAQILNKPTITESFTSIITIASNSWTLESGDYIYDYTMPNGYTDSSKFYISLYGLEGVDPSGWNVADYNKIYWCQSYTVSGVTKIRFYAKIQPGSQLNLLITAFK